MIHLVSGVSVSVLSLSKRFGAIRALSDVTFEVKRGEYFVVLGPVGSGRSTLLKCIAGIEQPDSGDILFDGTSVIDLPPEERGVGYMPPGYALFPHMTVWDNVAYGLRIRGYPRKVVEEKTREALDLVGLLDRADSYPHQLSGGQRQRIALARALASGAELLLLDEPLSALDAVLTLEVRREVRRLAKTLGLTVIHVTHNQEEAMAVADRVAVLRKGRIEQVGSPEEIYFNPATPFVAKFVSGANLLPAYLIETTDFEGIAEIEQIGRVRVMHRNLKAGSKVLVAIRPETIRLGEGSIRGRIEDLSHLGSITRVWVRVNGITLVADVEPRLDLKAGSDIALQLPERALAFEYKPEEAGELIE